MVFKPFTHLARQSFAKTFTHGYAQSVVAATQSSYASSTTPFASFGNHNAHRHGKSGTSQLHTTFHSVSSPIGIPNKPIGNTSGNENDDGGLAAYYDAWQKQQQHHEEKEWKQFQFPKRIGWKAPSAIIEGKEKGKGREKIDITLHPSPSDRGGIDRSYSASAVDDIKKAEDKATEVAAIATVDEAIANEISSLQQSSTAREEGPLAAYVDSKVSEVKEHSTESRRLESPSTISTDATAVASDLSPLSSDLSASTSVQDSESQALSEHIDILNQSQRYAEIPPVFESMLIQGLRPSIKAYNGLLAAAIHLPRDKHQIVPKALNVYSDMLRRKLLPDTAFYNTLIRLLSHRAMDVHKMKAVLDVKRLRFGGLNESGRFFFKSNETEYDILVEDDAISNAVKLFDTSLSDIQPRTYTSETYDHLITACAQHNRVDDMIRIYSHMESLKITPVADIFPSMIEAFSKSGDLSSAVECYNEYKALAIANDAGEPTLIDRNDKEVYAALVKAYSVNGNREGGNRFLAKIIDSFKSTTESREERLAAVQDIVVLDALVQEYLDKGNFAEAIKTVEERDLTFSARNLAMVRICSTAADRNEADFATKAYECTDPAKAESSSAVLSMLALHIRQGNVDRAREYWTILTTSSELDSAMIEPTVMYSVALIGGGHVDEGLMQARQGFGRIRAFTKLMCAGSEVAEQIDEGIELIGLFLAENGVVPSPQASVSFLWAMVENGGLVSPVAEQMLGSLDSENIASLSWQDLTLALQVEAEILSTRTIHQDSIHLVRFGHLLEALFGCGLPLEKHTSELIERTLKAISPQRPDLALKWQNYRLPSVQPPFVPAAFTPQPTTAVSTYADSFDPYAATTDHRSSALIADELDNQKIRPSVGLNEALIRFRNIRRAGRHPRYIVYAKLITSAAKEGRTNLVHDIIGMARQDIPYLPQYSVVRHGWSAILDAMVGACLTMGNRTLASQFHQEMLDMGVAPTANTFGLYITTLKDSTKTFDEATEAVKIFHRAKSEGVEASSFLYNALIGKLGKARRIDDCLFYFAEMRTMGIRPTSVTYGTIVNALCRVSDERFAEELFDEMESMPNYKPRPAPYNSLMQFFLTTKRDSGKVLAYYERMKSKGIEPTMHTYKLLIDTYATLDPINLAAAEKVLDTIRLSGQRPEAVHYASLIHAKGCALHDVSGARQVFDEALASGEIRPQACLYQALFESMVANHCVADTEAVLDDMSAKHVELTPYIANTLIHGWAMEKNISKSKAVYDSVSVEKREPSTYEAMTRAFLSAEDRESALTSVREMLSRGYPSAVSSKILELLGHSINASEFPA